MTSTPPAASAAVMVMVPATVPVTTPTLAVLKVAVLLPAGIRKVAVRPPVVNCTVSSDPPTAEAKVSVRIPVTSTGKTSPMDKVRIGWRAGGEVAGSPPIVAGGSAGRFTAAVNGLDAAVPRLSVTVIVKLSDPAAVGVPVSAPEFASIAKPVGRFAAVHLKGVKPPVAAKVCV